MPLTFVKRTAFTYPAGAQNLHANFHADETGFYVANAGTITAYNPDGTRNSGGDITLHNHPTADTIWGFTKTTDGLWATLTRDTGTGIIGTIRLYSATGTQMRVANVPDVVTGINVVANAFRAPKALVEVGGYFYVRVVRAVSGNMRWIRFDGNLQVQDDDLVINSPNPSALSDAASNGIGYILIIQHQEDRVYGINAANATIVSNLQTDLEATNTDPFGASAFGNTLFIADRNDHVYEYSGVPTELPSTGGGGGGIFAIISLMQFNGFLSRDFNQPRRRRF